MIRALLRRACSVLAALMLLTSAPAFAQQVRPNPGRPEDDRGAAFEPGRGRARDSVPGGTLLVLAYGVIWVVVFGYVAAQWRRQAKLRADIERLERTIEATKSAP